MSLYPYQVEGAEFLAKRRKALLADEMGLGKSAQAIAACDLICPGSVLIVCPASVVANWRREVDRFSNGSWSFEVVSYDMAVRRVDELRRVHWGALILDEAHYLKSRTAKRTKAIFGEKCDGAGGLVEVCGRVFLLTGTPMPNNPSELWPALRACCPEAITGPSGKPYSFWQHVSAYCVTRDNGFGQQIVGGKRHGVLREKLAPFMLRRRKADVLPELPPIRFDHLYFDGTSFDSTMPEAQRDQTWTIAKVLQEEGVEGLAKIAGHVATLRRLTGLAKVDLLLPWLRDWLDGCDRKIVLFAQHREVIAALRQKIGMLTCSIDGSLSADQRQVQVEMFQTGERRVFIGQVQAAGTGITLTAASDLVFVESSWVPAENEQAAMRIHRIGQKDACLARFATLAGSIDEQIQKAVARKTADISRIMG